MSSGSALCCHWYQVCRNPHPEREQGGLIPSLATIMQTEVLYLLSECLHSKYSQHRRRDLKGANCNPPCAINQPCSSSPMFQILHTMLSVGRVPICLCPDTCRQGTPLCICVLPALGPDSHLSPRYRLYPQLGPGEKQEKKSRKVCIPTSTVLQCLYVQQSAPINPPSAWPARFITSP